MVKISHGADLNSSIDDEKRDRILAEYVDSLPGDLERILLLPPDKTRKPSGAGILTNELYELLKDKSEIDIMPATGTHMAMTEEELSNMFGEDIPLEEFFEHRWRQDTVSLGTIPSEFVEEVSEGIVSDEIEVEVNERLLDDSYDLIISIGQVLPHEVAGMANYNKNILVGCGGVDIINKSHFVGAAYGMERLIGRDHNPVRNILDYAQERFLQEIPLDYILTVNSSEIDPDTGLTDLAGLFIGKDRETFEKAVELSQERNITKLEQPVEKFVVYLDPEEFKSTWLGNKAIYRTRMGIKDGGEVIVIAPGLTELGEDEDFDRLIRKYGYVGREKILELVEENKELRENLAAPAHLIHGSSDGRFSVTYASDGITREEVEGVNFKYMSIEEVTEKYDPEELKEGYNTLDKGERIYYIENPAIGLWVTADNFG